MMYETVKWIEVLKIEAMHLGVPDRDTWTHTPTIYPF
jgi:hypothetical protein